MDHVDWIIKQRESISKLSQPDWHYADVGACKGEILTSLLGLMDKGYAFEPNPTNYARLSQQFGSTEVSIIPNAVSNKVGEITFYYGRSPEEGSLLGYDMNYTPMTSSITVPCTTLDEYFADKQVDFIKVDVEGAEWDVFEGATELLKRDILWQVEFHLDEHWHKREILFENDYNIFDLDFNKLDKDAPRPYLAFLSKKETLI
jgi:FkbM family methyltransferase